MRSYKTKKVIAGTLLVAQLFTSTPMFAQTSGDVNVNSSKNNKIIIEKTDIQELREHLENKDYISFQKKYDELIKRGLIDAEPIVRYAPVLGPKTREAISILKQNGYLLEDEKPSSPVKEEEPIEVVIVEEESKPEKKTSSSIEGFKDEMKRTPYNEWDEQKQLEKALTIFERNVEYLKLLYEGDKEYPYTHYIGERWLREFNNSLSKFESQYPLILRYDNSKEELDKIIKKHFPELNDYEKTLGKMLVIRNNAQFIFNELKLMRDKLNLVSPVQMHGVVKETKKEISNRIIGPLERIFILDSNKMSYLYSYSIKNNLKPNYLDVLEHITSDKEFIGHKKWLTENYFQVVNFNDFNKQEVIFAYNELSLGTQHALFKYYLEKHGKDNIPNAENFAIRVFGLNIQGYETASLLVQYFDRLERFDSRTQFEIYRRIGGGTTFAESESDWINLEKYVSTDVNNALGKLLKTDIVFIRDQTKDRYELKSASIKTPGSDIREEIRRMGSVGAHIQEAFSMVEQNYVDSTINIQSGGVRVSGAPHLHGDRLEKIQPRGHSRNLDYMFGRNRIETSVPTSNVRIVRSLPELSALNYPYIQKGMFTNFVARAEEKLNYNEETSLSKDESSFSEDKVTNYSNNLRVDANAEGPSRISKNKFNWNRDKTQSKKTNETDYEKTTNISENTKDNLSFESYNRNVISTNNFNVRFFDAEGELNLNESPSSVKTIVPNDEEYSISNVYETSGFYEYYSDSNLFRGNWESYSRGNFGRLGVENETKSFENPITGESEIKKEDMEFNNFKEWDFENTFNYEKWQLHLGTQQINPYTNSLFFTPMYRDVFTLRPENSYYVKFGNFETINYNNEINQVRYETHKYHDYFKNKEDLPESIRRERNVFDSDVSYHGAGGVLGIPFLKNNEIGFGYVHNQTLMEQHKHLGILSYSWRQDSIFALSLYQGAYNIERDYRNLFSTFQGSRTRENVFNYRILRDSKSIERLYEESEQAFFVEGTLFNKDNLNVKSYIGSGEEYNRFQAGLVGNYVHNLFNFKLGGDFDEGNEEQRKGGMGGFYLSNKKETAYLLASLVGEKEFNWRTDEAFRYLGEVFDLKVETKFYSSFSENQTQNKKGRFIGSEISFEDDKVVLYYFGGKDVYSENVEEHHEFNLMGGLVKFTPNLSLEAYGTWKGDMGNGAFLHPILTHNNKFGITGLLGYTKNKVNFNLLKEKVEDDYFTSGLAIGFRERGVSLLLMPVSYTNNFNYKHIIETGLSGTYWLPGGSMSFGTGYIHNIIQNKKYDVKNPFTLPHINNEFNSRLFYVYGEGSGRGFFKFDYTRFRLTGKFGENEIYRLNQLITSFEMSDFWKRIYLDFYFNHRLTKGNLIDLDDYISLEKQIKKYEVRGILGVEFYF